MAASNKCPSCEYVGAGKGLCDYGHIHCRRCPMWDDYSGRLVIRCTAAEEEPWRIYCTLKNAWTVVEASQEVTVKSREAPGGFLVPENMFRRGCRMITVVVGKDELADTFVIEEPLLTAASPYFKNALKQTFKEGLNNRVELEEENPEIFGLVNEYLHQGSIQQALHGVTVAKAAAKSPTMKDYCSLWLLAHYLQINPLMNYSMWQLLTLMDSGSKLGLADVEELYTKAPMDSILRKFLVQLCVWGSKEALKPGEDAPQDMLREMVGEFQRKCDDSSQNPLLDVANYYSM